MANDVTIKFGADTTEHAAKVAKMNEAHKETSGHLTKHVELGEKFTHGLERSLGHAISIVAVFREAAQALTEMTNKAAEMNKKVGGEVESLGSNLMTFGFTGENLEAQMGVVNRIGGRATKSERANMAAAMAKAQRERQEKGLPEITTKQFDEAMYLGARGGPLVYGQNMEDLTNVFTDQRKGFGIGINMLNYGEELARKRGGIPEGTADPLGVLLKGLPRDLRAEGRMREREFENDLAKEHAALSPFGQVARGTRDNQEVFAIKHPLGNAIINNPISQIARDASEMNQEAHRQAELLKLQQRRVLRKDNPHDEGKE